MRKALPKMLALSGILVHETGSTDSATCDTPATLICLKLRPKLSTLMGFTGYRTLLARALSLAAAEVPALLDSKVDAAGSLIHAERRPAPSRSDADINGDVVLVAQLLSLLVAFIGEKLTLQILREIWPDLPTRDFNSRIGDSE